MLTVPLKLEVIFTLGKSFPMAYVVDHVMVTARGVPPQARAPLEPLATQSAADASQLPRKPPLVLAASVPAPGLTFCQS